MRRLLLTVLALLISGGVTFAGGLPAADGAKVFDYLKKNNYQQWPLFPGTTKLYEGQHPHGALLTTYVSKDTLKAINNREGKVPNGGFIVKENYSAEKKLMAVTVMYRVKGYNADAGDWFWGKYAPDGTVLKSGKVGGCIGCHTAAIKNDWVFAGDLK